VPIFDGILICRDGGLRSPGIEPAREFVGKNKDSALLSSRQTVYGQAALFFPALDRALIASEEACNLFPGIETPVRRLLLASMHSLKCPEVSCYVPCLGEQVP
jgi:hypothetical protein